MKKITLTPRMVFWDSEWNRGGTLERLFALHAALCDRLVLPRMEPASEGYSVCARTYVQVFQVCHLTSSIKTAPSGMNEIYRLEEGEPNGPEADATWKI